MISGLRKRRNDWIKMKKFKGEFNAFKRSAEKTKSRFELSENDFHPCLDDNTANTDFDRHYVYHVAWAVRKVKEINPAFHVDFSSSLHFCTTLSAFIPVHFYDFRPAMLGLSDLKSEPGDLTHISFSDNSVDSLSCMHTIEHIGLGRYGDPIDYDGDLKAITELKRVVKPGGSLLFVTPVGKPRIAYNAHRIYSFEQVADYFSGFELREFSLVPDDPKEGGLIRYADPALVARQKYGCGCFWFVKK